MNANIQSIYIPRMCKTTTEDKIRQVMHNYCIGSVSYVDFTCVNKKPGFIEDNSDEKFKSAFIHFDKSRQFAHLSVEYTMFWDKIERGEECKLFVGRNDAISTHTHEYWRCFKNNNPISRTQMNIHQIVDAGKYLEKAHNGLVETVLEQKEKITTLEKQVDGLSKQMYHLLGGLYCQNTQGNMLEKSIAGLSGSEEYNNLNMSEDTHKWTIWPTTRQGDDCERRLDELEKKISNKDKNENTNILEKLEKKLYADYLKHQRNISTSEELIEYYKENEWYEETEIEEEKCWTWRKLIYQIEEIYEEVSGKKFQNLIEKYMNEQA